MSEIKNRIEKVLDSAESLNETLNSFLSVERNHAIERAESLEKSANENQTLRGFAIAVKDNSKHT